MNNIRHFDEEIIPDPEEGVPLVYGDGVYMIDTTIAPTIYPTDNPDYYALFCIDFQPESVPTIAAFNTEQEAYAWIEDQFPDQYASWFPAIAGHEAEHVTCTGCFNYAPLKEVKGTLKGTRCRACRTLLKQR